MTQRRLAPARVFALASLLLTALSGVGCASSPATYALRSPENAADYADLNGSLSVEATQSGRRLLVVQLAELPPPERLGSGLTEFVVWIEDGTGRRVNAGALRYDRARHSGNLLATTDLSAFTVQITGERSGDVSAPSEVLVAQRKVAPN